MFPLRGEFRHQLGVTPNNITEWGAQQFLAMALQDSAMSLYVGLCAATFAPDLTTADIDEPTIGTNGYARKQLSRNGLDWPVTGISIGTPYIESKTLVWTPTGSGFDKTITRLFITNTATGLDDPIFCISAALSQPVKIDDEFQSTYRIYAG